MDIKRPWPAVGVGWLIAMLVLVAVLIAAFVADVKITNLSLWLIGGLALSILVG